jgi:isoleucyl-tRNA synthetase
MVRTIQSLRKEKDFVITDHINVYYNGDTDIDHMLDTYKDYVENETLANKIEKQEVNSEEYDLNGHPIKIEVEKA